MDRDARRGAAPDPLPHAWAPADLAVVLGRFWAAVAAGACAHAGRTAFVQKETWAPLWLDALLDLAPGARLVHIVRDPRDVVASFTQQRWAPSDPVEAARFYAGVMARWREVRAAVPADRVHEVRLEDLVADPRGVLTGVCDFYGLPWDDALLAHDLGRARAGRWRRDLPAESHAAVAAVLRPWIEAYGYAPA
jgi:hypothetical protein